MTTDDTTDGGAIRLLVVTGLAMSVVGGLVIALSWGRDGSTVLGGAVLAAAGQVVALFGLAGQQAFESPPKHRDPVG